MAGTRLCRLECIPWPPAASRMLLMTLAASKAILSKHGARAAWLSKGAETGLR